MFFVLFLSWLHSNFVWDPFDFKDRKKDWHYRLPDPWKGQKSRWLWRKRHRNTKQEFQGSLWNSCEDAVIRRKNGGEILTYNEDQTNVQISLSSYNSSLKIISTYMSCHKGHSVVFASMILKKLIKFYNIKNLRVKSHIY